MDLFGGHKKSGFPFFQLPDVNFKPNENFDEVPGQYPVIKSVSNGQLTFAIKEIFRQDLSLSRSKKADSFAQR